ncbi:DegT/DnrJ/EryC1/StrS family aminotransferase [Aerococcaceae bacterium INB8]|uniref:DegT/DnrJ/EryC1/StrS family aminotransferase n=1 Tax=Ruoffia halotolerans TaxID=2748684 RepID=A0A839A8B8_9LACT|nr:aminotransferase class I/II-fold pyridoxal phosphate-dependent enzyme [Ruoffia halotolerans]MBA5730050.1 DegT/DnrJ/EryC1/StrS family aminotransferase [Ruoffia halotolerans]
MNRIFLASPHMSQQGYEQEYVQEAFDTNWIAPLGKNVNSFEDELAHMVGIQHAAALSSGTAAIHLALKAVGVEKDDIVFVQSLTFSATVNPIIYQHAKPVFIDSAPGDWNMDPEKLREAFKKYKPKAVIVVHLYGLSARIDEIKAICEEHNVPLIEDAAESLGTIYKDQWTGTYGDYGIYSFNGNKIITTSGGGMLVSDNKEGIDKARFWATQAREQAVHYQHEDIGYNYRLSNVLAGIGRGQLKVLEDRVEKKREIFNRYVEGFKDIEEITFIKERDNERANYWLSAIILESDKVTPVIIMDALSKENIESRPIWKPMHMQPVFEQYDAIGGEVSEAYFEKGLCLPSDTKMTDEEQDKVIEIIKALWS